MKNESKNSEYLKSEVILAVREVRCFSATCSAPSHFTRPPTPP